MSDVKDFTRKTLRRIPDEFSEFFIEYIEFYFNEVNKLGYESEPDYSKVHSKITETLASLGHSETTKDNFYIYGSESNTVVIENLKVFRSTVIDESSEKIDEAPRKIELKKRLRSTKTYCLSTDEDTDSTAENLIEEKKTTSKELKQIILK